jgi:hypothetical protein
MLAFIFWVLVITAAIIGPQYLGVWYAKWRCQRHDHS